MFVKFSVVLFLSLSILACQINLGTSAQNRFQESTTRSGQSNESLENQSKIHPLPENAPREIKLMLESALEQTKITKIYDPSYIVLSYPNGDVPLERGVCTDVVIRAMRNAGTDLQKVVHEDMKTNFAVYPQKWGLKKPDSNIDHRRVPNLQTFFSRRGKSLPVTNKPEDYKPGDIVSWDLDGKGLAHIGLVSNIYSETTKRYLIIHNIGSGAEAEDALFSWKITGHYRYF